MSNFILYLYFDLQRNDSPWTSEDPIYVGEGTEDRPYIHLQEHELSKPTYFHNHLRRMLNDGNRPKIVILPEVYATKQDAQSAERELIQSYGKKCNKTGCLYNLSDGGSGIVGHPYQLLAETRQRLSHAMLGNDRAKGTISEKRILIVALWMGQVVHRFNYLREATSKGFKPCSVSAAINGKQQTAYGFKWMREDDYLRTRS